MTLVCPKCRRSGAEGLVVHALVDDPGGKRCPGCGTVHPVVDGIPIVLRDLDRWMQTEGQEVLCRADLPPVLAEDLRVRAGGALARNAHLRRVYANSREGALQSWLTATGEALTGAVLEMGSGAGSLGGAAIVALDTNFGTLRGHASAHRVCGDAADPPFLASSFDAVALPNLLDSCGDPGLVLGQADALLRPGGTLVVTCAYAFVDEITPLHARFTPTDLLAGLTGQRTFLGYSLNYAVAEHHEGIEWPLVVSERTRHVHRAQAIVARKLGG